MNTNQKKMDGGKDMLKIKAHSSEIVCDGPGECSFLSHAHKDHLNGIKKAKKLLAHPATLELTGLEKKERAKVSGIRMLNAGHILGSCQLLVENGVSELYTGDLRFRDSLLFKKADVAQVDRVYLDCTYAFPGVRFPKEEDVLEEFRKWLKQRQKCNLLLGAYKLGKAQEIIRILNEEGIVPIVDEETKKYCEVYSKYGIKLEVLEKSEEEAKEILKRGFVAVVPVNKAKKYHARAIEFATNKKTLSAVFTGWALFRRFYVHRAFPLSDHSDFYELLQFIEESEAKEVVAMHCRQDQAKALAQALALKGVKCYFRSK